MSNKLREALEAILKDGHGCRFCDSGKLRTENNPAKDHDEDCGYFLAKAALKEDDVKRQKVFEVIDTVKAQYPASVFPDNGTSPDAQAGMVARLICDNIKREMEIMLNEEPPTNK